MISKLLISICVAVFLIVIPYLEVNVSHVFNPDWPPHARFHEVWQLTTNGLLGILCLWLTWVKNEIPMASVLCACVMSGVAVAHFSADYYGGSVLTGNLNTSILGLELAVFASLLVVILSFVAWYLDKMEVSDE